MRVRGVNECRMGGWQDAGKKIAVVDRKALNARRVRQDAEGNAVGTGESQVAKKS